MTFDIGLHEVCERVGVRYVITKFSRMDSLSNFLTHGAPLRARELCYKCGAPVPRALRARGSPATSKFSQKEEDRGRQLLHLAMAQRVVLPAA